MSVEQIAGRRTVVFMNPMSGPKGSGLSPGELAALCRDAGLDADVVSISGENAVTAERIGRDADLVIAVGGDGTVSSVAAAIAGTGSSLGIIPAGTLNHFARDLGIPLDVRSAFQVIAAGETVSVDAAEVNGRIFVNNSSIGLYPTFAAERERWMKRGLPKRIAMFPAAIRALARFPNLGVRVNRDEEADLSVRTPLLFIGNNEYQFSGWGAGTRSGLRDAALQIAMVDNPSRWSLAGLAMRAAFGLHLHVPELHVSIAKTVRVRTFRKHIKVALDGEVVRMKSPLVYSIRPGALKVIVPHA